MAAWDIVPAAYFSTSSDEIELPQADGISRPQ